MRQGVIAGITALLISVLSPMALMEPLDLHREEVVLVIREDPIGESRNAPSFDEAQSVRVDVGDAVVAVTLQEYVTGVLLSEMPASFLPEALKAQAVAARTFALRQIESGKHSDCDLCGFSDCCQAWSSQNAMADKLGEAWNVYWERAEDAVEQTDGEVLVYNGGLIDAVYFSCSGGTTEDAVAVWGSEVPYLQSVPSTGEESASKYESQVTVSHEEFREILLQENPAVSLSSAPDGWVQETTLSNGGGVQTMKIGGQLFQGTRLRSLFQLNSTKFSVSMEKEDVVFTVYGYGHRVGMSQYGANAMAEAGRTYDEILAHYYTGVDLEKRNP